MSGRWPGMGRALESSGVTKELPFLSPLSVCGSQESGYLSQSGAR